MLRPLLAVLLAAAAALAQRPNVVLIIADDQAWTDFGFLGSTDVATPHLDRLAAAGACFPRGYVPTALCAPSLATLLSGLYPHQHRLTGNDPPAGGARERMLRHIDAIDTLPGLLGRHGYRSLQTGKWWLADFRRGGFTDGMTHGDPARGGRHGDDGLRIGRETMQPIADFVDRCARDGAPFFLWYAPLLPHTPHDPPERLLQKYRTADRPLPVARYHAMCEWFDETCGQLLGLLDQRGLTEDTLVLFAVDNGWIQNPAGPGFAPRSKRSPYEAGVRTPLLLRWPGRIAPGRHEVPVSTIDVVPTVLAACGVPVPDHLPGTDLLAVARGTAPARPGVFGASFTHDLVDLQDPRRNLLRRWTVQGRWKWIEGEAGTGAELYDVLADPHERTDLAQERPRVVRSLAASVDRWWPARSRLDRPNILLLLTDDQRADALGSAGHPFLQTPHLDALAARGQRFQNAFVTTPICAASRASILTGAWEGTHHYTFGTPPLAAAWVRDAWPGMLRGAGYRTGFVGKWGVDTAAGATTQLWDSFAPLSPPYLRPTEDGGTAHLTDLTAEAALAFLRGVDRQQPFCLMVSFNAPHAEDSNPEQYIPPPSLRGLYRDAVVDPPPLSDPAFFAGLPPFQQRSLNRIRWRWRFDSPAKHARMVRDYCAMITGVDRAVGRLLDELQARGLADDTVVLFTSDNGCFLGERGFAGKWTVHEPSIRVPLLVHDPRVTWPIDPTPAQMALNVDLAPTLLALAGLAAPASCQGQSLLPLLRGETPAWRQDFFVEHRFDHPDIPKHEGVRGGRWVYTRWFEQEPLHEELYDLAADPQEARNLADDPAHAATLAELRRRCDELRGRYLR